MIGFRGIIGLLRVFKAALGFRLQRSGFWGSESTDFGKRVHGLRLQGFQLFVYGAGPYAADVQVALRLSLRMCNEDSNS